MMCIYIYIHTYVICRERERQRQRYIHNAHTVFVAIRLIERLEYRGHQQEGNLHTFRIEPQDFPILASWIVHWSTAENVDPAWKQDVFQA